MPIRTIAVLNQKGGTAKTTTTVNLAAGLAGRGRTVLVVDIDPQASASAWLAPGAADPFLEDLLARSADLSEVVRETAIDRLALLPASPRLAARALALVGEIGRELVLRERLSTLSSIDYVLLDCPPELGLLSVNALLAASEVLIPVATEPMAVDGLVQVFQTLDALARRFDHRPAIAGILPVRVRSGTLLAREILVALDRRFPGLVLPPIRETIYAAESPAHHTPIAVHRPGCTAAVDYGLLVERVLAQEAKAA